VVEAHDVLAVRRRDEEDEVDKRRDDVERIPSKGPALSRQVRAAREQLAASEVGRTRTTAPAGTGRQLELTRGM